MLKEYYQDRKNIILKIVLYSIGFMILFIVFFYSNLKYIFIYLLLERVFLEILKLKNAYLIITDNAIIYNNYPFKMKSFDSTTSKIVDEILLVENYEINLKKLNKNDRLEIIEKYKKLS